jgi:hypothetical protein
MVNLYSNAGGGEVAQKEVITSALSGLTPFSQTKDLCKDFDHIGGSAFQQFDAKDAVHFLQTLLDTLYPVPFHHAVEDQDSFPAPDPLHLHGFEENIPVQQKFQDVFGNLQPHIDPDHKGTASFHDFGKGTGHDSCFLSVKGIEKTSNLIRRFFSLSGCEINGSG